MKPKRPVPVGQPFISFLTNTYRRPDGLTECLKSVCRQTAVADIEQLVVPDHLGHSPADAVYGRLPLYASALRGRYVHVLGDDDVLASETVVAKLQKFAAKHHDPPVIIVQCRKDGVHYPKCGVDGDPVEGDVDLCCFVIRNDVWTKFVAAYCPRYKCDWDGLLALREVANGPLVPYDLLFAVGKASGGRPEEDW